MKKDALKQPFFAALLESQHPQYYPGPGPKPTNKEDDIYQTHKYPSDNEDNPGGPKDPGMY
jgi:hypothetical protein